MKKFLSIILTTILLITPFSFTTSAENPEVIISETTKYFEDGSSITTTITQQTSNIMPLSSTYNLTGSKTKTGKDSSGNVLYKFKITGTFLVNEGVSATCTAVSCSASDCNYGWELDSSTTSKSGNTAHATGVFKKKTLFITTQTIELPISLSCDKNGVLS
ncbi:MAG: hypothetical protein E7521_03890 [Ruminococcaceae bacterium]|nr:hypothetical protein [Oscillospiraceae bacterium]